MVVIKFNSDEEMMTIITDNGQEIFQGNYWDFDGTPEGLRSFIEDLGFNVELEEEKNVDEEDYDYDSDNYEE